MVPVGDANIISGICKGSIELKTSNLLKKMQKLLLFPVRRKPFFF